MWIAIDNEHPDDDTIVLIHVPDASEPIWLGYFDGEDRVWRYITGEHCRPTHWMDLPETPARCGLAGQRLG